MTCSAGRRRIGILLGVCILCAWAGALQAQQLAFRRFDHRDGLPESQIFSLLEDQAGFIWVGAGDSLSRLGASGFRTMGEAQGLKCKNLTVLLQDHRGSIWAGGEGLAEVRGSVIVNYGKAEGLAVAASVYALAETTRGELHVGTRLGLFRQRQGRFEQVKLPGNWFYTPIRSLVADGAGGLWIGSRKGLLAHWDGQTLTPAPLPKGFATSSVLDLSLDRRGVLKVLCAKGILRLEGPGVWRPEPLPGLRGTPAFTAFQEDAQGGLVVTLGVDGVYVRSPGGEGRHLTHREGLPRCTIERAIRDRNGILWVGTDGNGLLALPTPQLQVLAYSPETGLDLGLGSVLHFLELRPGRVLMATYGGLLLWDQDRGVLQRWNAPQGLPSDQVWTLEADGQGGAWVGTSKGMVHWKDGRLLPGPVELKTAFVNQFLRHQGRLWVGTSDGLAELDLNGNFIARSQPPQEVATLNVSQMLATPGGLLVGTGLGPYTVQAGHWKKAYPDAPVALLEIRTLGEDAQGQLWVGTPSGLFGLVGAAGARHWQAMAGSLRNSISWVRFLPTGEMGVGHNKGVTLVRAAGLPLLLTRNLGLLSDETNQDGAMVDHLGRFWIGMAGGACILDPKGLEATGPLPLPAPRILEAVWGHQSVWLPKALTLPPNPANLSVRFDTPLPCVPAQPIHEVWIEGLDAGWRGVDGAGTAVQIAQLGPGNYAFRIRASLDGATWSESAPLALVVARAWYQTPLARAGLVLLGGLLLALLGHFRFKRLKKRAQLLELKIQERTGELARRNLTLERVHHQLKRTTESRLRLMNTVSHDLRSPLTSILLAAGRLREGATPSGAVLDILERESLRLESLLKGLLDHSRAEAITDTLNARLCRPSEILQGLTETFKLKAEARDLETELELDPASSLVWVLADVTAMQQVLFNLIENALKFTASPGPVGIRTRVLPEAWFLEVWDRGRGIEPAKLEAIFLPFTQSQKGDERTGWGLGLSICQSIVEAHEGVIRVDSVLGQGSVFRVTLPLVLPPRAG